MRSRRNRTERDPVRQDDVTAEREAARRTIRVDPARRVPQARLQVEAYNVAAKLT
ncbi:hypothetical protein [Amycolatopsis sp. cmx-8-4]|uniref:hypothetical protein n=1 Tax=Amycolatopsis sp. cmx-8-4 TaxID=2790947 RepID=UPI00397851A6